MLRRFWAWLAAKAMLASECDPVGACLRGRPCWVHAPVEPDQAKLYCFRHGEPMAPGCKRCLEEKIREYTE